MNFLIKVSNTHPKYGKARLGYVEIPQFHNDYTSIPLIDNVVDMNGSLTIEPYVSVDKVIHEERTKAVEPKCTPKLIFKVMWLLLKLTMECWLKMCLKLTWFTMIRMYLLLIIFFANHVIMSVNYHKKA